MCTSCAHFSNSRIGEAYGFKVASCPPLQNCRHCCRAAAATAVLPPSYCRRCQATHRGCQAARHGRAAAAAALPPSCHHHGRAAAKLLPPLVGGKRVTNKEVEIWDQSLTKDRRVMHRPMKNVGEQVTNKEVEIWDQSLTKDRRVTFEPKSQLPSPQAPINMIGSRARSPGIYRALRLRSKSLDVVWERAFIHPLTL